MDRRQFLGTAGGVAGVGSLAWLLRHFATRDPLDMFGRTPPIPTRGDISVASVRAFVLGKPVLVLVIPEDQSMRYQRGHLFGELLNHGGQGLYLDLALSELACATMASVREQARDVRVDGEPLLLLLETEGSALRGEPIDPEIGYELPDWWKDGHDNSHEVDAFLTRRSDAVAAAIRARVAPTRARLAERATTAESRTPGKARAVRAALASGLVPDRAALDCNAALVRMLAEDPEARRPEILEALAAAASERVRGPLPAGARWATADGCGTTLEGEPDDRNWACGMGHVPDLSRRFLWFFTKA